jgi:alkylated DNA repair dioxygenase AlkB
MFLNKHIDDRFQTALGDAQVPKSFSQYAPLCFETLSLTMLPIVQDITGKQLYPSYSFGRIYYNGATLPIHIDRPSCEYSVTLCISNDPNSWEIWFKDSIGADVACSLEPGDMVVYKGHELRHWRNEYTGLRQCQAFLHYVDQNGQYSDFKYDKRHYLGI